MSDSQPASANRAVFLSYASQDTEAAKRIAGALRVAGVEVWLDQEGGLDAGDAWDRKIREQINACALFIKFYNHRRPHSALDGGSPPRPTRPRFLLRATNEPLSIRPQSGRRLRQALRLMSSAPAKASQPLRSL